MVDHRLQLGRGMRGLLLACGVMNLAGAITLAPPFPEARRDLALPEPDPFFLWLLSAWILGFGVSYFYQGWTGQASRGVLAISVWGKAVFAGLMIGHSIQGTLPPFAGYSASPDLLLAGVFLVWLVRSLR